MRYSDVILHHQGTSNYITVSYESCFIEKIYQTSAMFSALMLSLSFADFHPVFRVITSKKAEVLYANKYTANIYCTNPVSEENVI